MKNVKYFVLVIFLALFFGGVSFAATQTQTHVRECTDSDGGANIYIRGTVTVKTWTVDKNNQIVPSSEETATYPDYCDTVNNKTLVENFCHRYDVRVKKYYCQYGCTSGHCRKIGEKYTLEELKYENSCYTTNLDFGAPYKYKPGYGVAYGTRYDDFCDPINLNAIKMFCTYVGPAMNKMPAYIEITCDSAKGEKCLNGACTKPTITSTNGMFGFILNFLSSIAQAISSIFRK